MIGTRSQCDQRKPRRVRRRGIVLIVVMVVVVMVSLAGFRFVTSMANELRAVRVRGEQLQMENAIASAEESLQSSLEPAPAQVSPGMSASASAPTSPRDDEAELRGVVVDEGDRPRSRVRFTVIAPHYDETGAAPWRYGLESESARLNLHAILHWETDRPGSGRAALLGFPGMTEDIADALLDWMDADSVQRPSGAEADYYSTLNPPYAPRNAVPESLEELLLVKGVTRSLMYGQDANQNHRLDLDEQSSALATRSREQTGERGIPWAELLTLYSQERNQSRQQQPRIDLNQPDLAQLQRQLTAAFDSTLADYAVLYRQFGPSTGGGQFGPSAGGGSAASGAGPAASGGNAKPSLAFPGRFPLSSPLELVQSRVQVQDATGIGTVVASPLSGDATKLAPLLDRICDLLTVQNIPTVRGRVNVNLAPLEVLQGIPGIDKALADQIVASRGTTANRDPTLHEHPCWLFTEGLVDFEKMKQLAPYLTTGGDVYRAQIVAFSEASRLSQRVEVVIDAAHAPIRTVYRKDLQMLGRGYPWDVLDTPGGISVTQPGASNATPFGD